MSLEIKPLAALYPLPIYIFLDWYNRKGENAEGMPNTEGRYRSTIGIRLLGV